ncbi:MAG: hypothetical protein O7D32_03690 [bacterium]|nr:hypothetical protein [bacterium]
MKLFDFLIVPVYRSGGTAIQVFLSAHPGIVVIPKADLDHCLEDHREEQLLEYFQDLMLANPDARVGLVQHKYIGEHDDLDGIAERLSKIVRKDGLVFLVRNQFDALLSGMNHRRIAQYCDYSFAKAGLFWPELVELGRGVRPFLDGVESASCEPAPSADRINVEDAFVSEEALDYVRYAAIQETYERHFSRPKIFDYDEILSADNRNAMQSLFETLRTDKDFYLPFFATPQAGMRHRFLSHNRMGVVSQDVPERTVVLKPATRNEFAVFGKGAPMGRIYDGYIRDLFTEELVLVTAPFEPSETAKRQVDAFLRGFLYPLWRKNYEIVRRVIDDFRSTNLSRDQKSLIKDGLASDAVRFLEMNPGLGNNWRASWGSP